MTEGNGHGVRAVLYDLDGTLADSTALIMSCYRHTMTTHLGECPPDEEWLSGFGKTLDTQIARFARDDAEFEAMMSTYRAHQDEHTVAMLRPFDGAVETVRELRRRGLKLAIVTSRRRYATLRAMDLCGLTELFDVIVTPDEVSNPKPHPEPVLQALTQLGVDASEALFVGDSPHDMEAGKAAGTRVAGALWGPFPRATLEDERPHWLLETQADVLALVGGGD